MAVDDIAWRILLEELVAEQAPTPCGLWVALLQFAHIFTRFQKETSTDA